MPRIGEGIVAAIAGRVPSTANSTPLGLLEKCFPEDLSCKAEGGTKAPFIENDLNTVSEVPAIWFGTLAELARV